MRQFFKTTKVHHCFSQELGEPQPEKCKCRKFIAKSFAEELVSDGVADWLIVYPLGTTNHDIVMKGIAGKTPRAQTIESAHIERYVDQLWNVGNADFSDPEVLMHLDRYHDIEIEERLKLFRKVGLDLIALKNFSDSHGDLAGEAGRVLTDKLINQADGMKEMAAIDDPWVGHAIFMPLGGDQRTDGAVGKNVAIGEEKLDNVS